MRKANNDNEPFPFQTLATITGRVLQTNAKKDNRRGDQRRGGDDDEEQPKQRREYVERRLREIADFELRADGHKVPSRRRPFR